MKASLPLTNLGKENLLIQKRIVARKNQLQRVKSMNHPMKKKYDKNGAANVERVQNIWNFSCSGIR